MSFHILDRLLGMALTTLHLLFLIINVQHENWVARTIHIVDSD